MPAPAGLTIGTARCVCDPAVTSPVAITRIETATLGFADASPVLRTHAFPLTRPSRDRQSLVRITGRRIGKLSTGSRGVSRFFGRRGTSMSGRVTRRGTLSTRQPRKR